MQAVPHAPQLATSLPRSTRASPHADSGVVHISPLPLPVHTPALQLCTSVHADPHVPQLSGSLCRSVQTSLPH